MPHRHTIGLFGLVSLMATIALCPPARAQSAPYTAYVNADEVYVRSGPGTNYYPTQKLQRGDRIEVYRHDPGGWLAIRPPEGSFSWITGEFVEQADGETTGKVIGDRVVVRIGSEFSDVRDVIQVRMRKNEDVEILESKVFNPGPAEQTWHKITPPSGEFRWIHGRFVSETLEETIESDEPRRNLLIPADDAGEVGDVRQAEHQEPAGAMPVPNSNVSTSPRPRAARENAAIEPEERPIVEESGDLDHEPSIPRVARRTTSPAGVPLSREERVARELDLLELQLSAMVSEEPSAWAFDDLFNRASDALERGETPLERGRARLLLSRLEKFADIKRRIDSNTQVAATPATRSGRTTSPLATTPVMTASPRAASEYDGVGLLARVQTQRPGVPAYALTDSSGAIRYFVTPAPGVNLRHYLGREVGVTGNVGFAPELNQQHVTARNVKVLGDGVIRR